MKASELIELIVEMRSKADDGVASFDESIVVSADSFSKGFDQGASTTCSIIIQLIEQNMTGPIDESE